VTAQLGKGGTPGGAETRDRILRAAELLLAEKGIDGVSLREVNRAAGQSNTGAVQYYFGDRAGLVVAVIARHRTDDEMRRHTLLDAYERRGRADLAALAGALVMPLAAKLNDPDGGREYLRVSAEYYLRAPLEELVHRRVRDTSFERWSRLLKVVVPQQDKMLPLRYPAVRFTLMELSRRASAPARRDDQLFASHLTDLVTSLLGTPPSRGTARLLEARTAGRTPREPPARPG
jgi:AcrR family transcriptional regulator